jgi:hypothetical protein
MWCSADRGDDEGRRIETTNEPSIEDDNGPAHVPERVREPIGNAVKGGALRFLCFSLGAR